MQPIKAGRPFVASDDPETVAAVTEALPIVAQLAVERAKAWPKRPDHIQAHKARIRDLVSELRRIADRVGDMTPEELEELGRTELRRKGRPLPRAVKAPAEQAIAERDARADLDLARDLLAAEERKLVRIRSNVAALRRRVSAAEQKVASL